MSRSAVMRVEMIFTGTAFIGGSSAAVDKGTGSTVEGSRVGGQPDVLDGEREGAEQLCPISQRALHDLRHTTIARERRALEGVPQGCEEDFAGLGEFAADHEQLGVEQ